MRRTDAFNQWLGSDSDLSFAEWQQQREGNAQRDVTMPLGLTFALVIFGCCAFGTGLVITKAVGLW